MIKREILILAILFVAPLFGNNCLKTDTKYIYVVLNRNSHNVKFASKQKELYGIKENVLTYDMTTGIHDYPLEIGFVYFGKILPDMYQHEESKKSVKFLDSITFYDEKYIMETKAISRNLFHWKKLKETRVFLIDMGTLKNDSVMMYEVTVGFDGYER